MEYKEITEGFIKIMEDEEYEVKGQSLLNKREELLSKLKAMDFDKKEFTEIFKELNLVTLEEMASKLLNGEKNKIKEEIFNLKNNRNAAKTYGVNFKNINFINKEV
ncbi:MULTISPECIES: hypothetical protein [unclassified Clostridium]|uniref:hypothetical protein n=1 Tax=unclassified Clostridium TaxID=2614128 RepID=UPI0032165A89